MNLTTEISKVTDYGNIAGYDVLRTPAPAARPLGPSVMTTCRPAASGPPTRDDRTTHVLERLSTLAGLIS